MKIVSADQVVQARRYTGLGVVVPTKDRPTELLALLDNLNGQTLPPDEVLVVDGSDEPVGPLIDARRYGFRIQYVRHNPPSAAAQRNTGIESLIDHYPLVGLLDDDIQLAPDAVQQMLEFWETDDSCGVAGASFNQQGLETVTKTGFFKRSRLADVSGLYCHTPGRVALSGWHSLIGTVRENTAVEWLQTGAAVWRAEVLEHHRFDEYFHSYSYLEDLDFSYAVSKRSRLMVVADARYEHLAAPGGRVDVRNFGRIEVRNRLYFVRKHGLSLGRCFAGLAIRWAMTVGEALRTRDRALLQRAIGNFQGVVDGFGRPASLRAPATDRQVSADTSERLSD